MPTVNLGIGVSVASSSTTISVSAPPIITMPGAFLPSPLVPGQVATLVPPVSDDNGDEITLVSLTENATDRLADLVGLDLPNIAIGVITATWHVVRNDGMPLVVVVIGQSSL